MANIDVIDVIRHCLNVQGERLQRFRFKFENGTGANYQLVSKDIAKTYFILRKISGLVHGLPHPLSSSGPLFVLFLEETKSI